MPSFVINGGFKLKGELEVKTAKNSALAILCASLLVKGKVKLCDLPKTVEMEKMANLLNSLGAKCVWLDKNTIIIDSSGKMSVENIDKESSKKMRASLMLWGSLIHRIDKFKLSKSGGCHLGERTVRPHVYALEKLGVQVLSYPKFYEIFNKGIHGAEVVMYEAGDTPTENVIMTAVLAPGVTTIKFASANYMVQDLCFFLNSAGAKIEGIGTSTLKITGVKKLHDVEYSIMPDPIEAMTWLSLGITTSSNLKIKNCPLDFLELEIEKLRVMGQKFSFLNKRKSKNNKFTIVDIEINSSKLTALPDKIHPLPFPGLNIDNLPLFIPILTQAKGATLVHDWVYENRAVYTIDLQKFGAKVILMDPHRVLVEGPTNLSGNEFMCPLAIRSAVVLLVCALKAKGKSILRNVYPILRAHEDIVERLNKVGARIQKIED